jgi:hypothetical protein
MVPAPQSAAFQIEIKERGVLQRGQRDHFQTNTQVGATLRARRLRAGN